MVLDGGGEEVAHEAVFGGGLGEVAVGDEDGDVGGVGAEGVGPGEVGFVVFEVVGVDLHSGELADRLKRVELGSGSGGIEGVGWHGLYCNVCVCACLIGWGRGKKKTWRIVGGL